LIKGDWVGNCHDIALGKNFAEDGIPFRPEDLRGVHCSSFTRIGRNRNPKGWLRAFCNSLGGKTCRFATFFIKQKDAKTFSAARSTM
jgi:hypothetical protein